MMLLLAILVLIILVVGWLLIAPIWVEINTYRQQYFLVIWGLKCEVKWKDGPVLRINIPFRSWEVDLLAKSGGGAKKEQKKKDRKSGVKVSRILGRILRVIRSFSIKRFHLDLDTSDVIWNGYLYPVFHLLHSQKRELAINYNGQVGLIIHLENRLIRMIWAYFR